MWKVYVGNLSSRIREMELADEFRAFGVVRSVWVARNPPGYAFIEFAKRREADDAISSLDGKHGWRVEMSRQSTGGHSHGSYGSENKCRDCGSSGHRARDCHSKALRGSHRRSPSPCHNTGSNRLSDRHSPLRRRSQSRSPLSENRYAGGHSPLRRRNRSRTPLSKNQYADRHNLLRRCSRSSSPLSENQYADSSPRKVFAQSGSLKSDGSKSPLSQQNNIREDSPTRDERDHDKSPGHDVSCDD